MARLISTLPEGKALLYIDDILLYSEDPMGREMVKLIGKFLDQVIQSGGKINVAKSELLKTEVKYLGFVVAKAEYLWTQSTEKPWWTSLCQNHPKH